MAAHNRKSAVTKSRFNWRDITLGVTCTPNYISNGGTHLELRVLAPKGAPVPITTTGYLSHFIDADELAAAGGAVPLFTAWLEREAKTKSWLNAEFRWRQGDLFAQTLDCGVAHSRQRVGAQVK